MTCVDIDLESTSQLHANAWTSVCQMESLQSLKVKWNNVHSRFPLIPAGSLPSLEKLSVWTYQNSANSFGAFLNSLDGSKLRYLSYYGYPFDLRAAPESTKNLKELELENLHKNVPWTKIVPGIFVMTKLCKLVVSKIKESHILPLIQNLPDLTTFYMYDNDLKAQTVCEVNTYLKGQNDRKLTLEYHNKGCEDDMSDDGEDMWY